MRVEIYAGYEREAPARAMAQQRSPARPMAVVESVGVEAPGGALQRPHTAALIAHAEPIRPRPNQGVESMKIHEYQAKEILRRYGVPVQPGKVATTPERGRGRSPASSACPSSSRRRSTSAGAARPAASSSARRPEQAREVAGRVLGMDIKGLTVEKVLVTPKMDIKEEYYLGIVIDRACQAPVVMVSAAGGVDIEEVAAADAREDHQARRWTCAGACLPTRRATCWPRPACPPSSSPSGGAILAEPGQRLHRQRRHAGRDQSARADGGRPGDGRRRQDPHRRQRPAAPERVRQLGRARGGQPAGVRGQGRRASPTSSSTATSASSATAPASS